MKKDFPSPVPIGLVLGAMLGLLAAVPCVGLFQLGLDPLQGHYLHQYIKLSVIPHRATAKPQKFLLLTRMIGTRAEPGRCELTTPILVTRDGVSPNAELVERAGRCEMETRPGQMKAWLRSAIYGGQTLRDLMATPLLVWGCLAVVCVAAGGASDRWRKNKAREPKQLRGPQLVTSEEFNREVQGDGFPIALNNRRTFREWLQGSRGKVLRIKRRDENKNIICMSDPGGGKTSILMQVLDEVERRG